MFPPATGKVGLKHVKTVLQAGAIAVRPGDGAPLILIATAKNKPHHWILPKGHIEPGETAEQTAVRELREETGVEGVPVAPAGTKEFRRKGKLLRVEYFVLRFHRYSGGGEDRQLKWVGMDEAASLLTFEEAREIVTESRLLIERAAATSLP